MILIDRGLELLLAVLAALTSLRFIYILIRFSVHGCISASPSKAAFFIITLVFIPAID